MDLVPFSTPCDRVISRKSRPWPFSRHRRSFTTPPVPTILQPPCLLELVSHSASLEEKRFCRILQNKQALLLFHPLPSSFSCQPLLVLCKPNTRALSLFLSVPVNIQGVSVKWGHLSILFSAAWKDFSGQCQARYFEGCTEHIFFILDFSSLIYPLGGCSYVFRVIDPKPGYGYAVSGYLVFCFLFERSSAEFIWFPLPFWSHVQNFRFCLYVHRSWCS